MNSRSIRVRRPIAALFLFAVSSALSTAHLTAASSPSDLLEQGIYSEETKGDVDAALKLYQQVVTEAQTGQAVAAQAQYRLGICYYKKKNYSQANAAFLKLTRDFPDQKDLVVLANKYLANAIPLMPAPWADGEEMQLDIKFPTGFRIGSAAYRVHSGELNGQKIWRLRSHLFAGTPQCSRVEVEADSFKPIRSWWKINVIGEADVTYSGSIARLKTTGKDEPREIDLGGVTYDNEEVIQLSRRLPLAPDFKSSLRIFTGLGGGNVLTLEYKVTAQEKVEVPAGSFDCYKVEVGLVHQTFWYSTDAHHYLVKFEGGGIIGELNQVVQRKEGEPVKYQDPLFGFSLTAPADWMFHRPQSRNDKEKATVIILDPDALATSVVNVGQPKVLGPDTPKTLRAWAEKEISDGEGSVAMKELTIRPESWKDRTVAGQPALSFIGDYMEGKDKKVCYAVFTFGSANPATFVLQFAARDFETCQPKFDAIIDSYKEK